MHQAQKTKSMLCDADKKEIRKYKNESLACSWRKQILKKM
jgi:hypothetical protein